MKLPRDISSKELSAALAGLGYAVTHQTGSHIRLTTYQAGEHHVTVPAHSPIRVGTLNAILRDVGKHHRQSREEVLNKLFG